MLVVVRGLGVTYNLHKFTYSAKIMVKRSKVFVEINRSLEKYKAIIFSKHINITNPCPTTDHFKSAKRYREDLDAEYPNTPRVEKEEIHRAVEHVTQRQMGRTTIEL